MMVIYPLGLGLSSTITISSAALTGSFILYKWIVRRPQTRLYNVAAAPQFSRWEAFRKAPAIIRSPESTLLPYLTKAEIEALPYSPDALPGGRYVTTPFGRIRVYEFGPEEGRRVVFVHGISTPCVSGRDICLELAARGCRVMTFDLPGRGYSDCPDVPQDMRLFTAILLAVCASSTAKKHFPIDLIGYSLGGCLVVPFMVQFPHLIQSLTLISPGGLLSKSLLSPTTLLALNPYTPRVLSHLIGRRRMLAEDGPSALESCLPAEGLEYKELDVAAVIRWQNKFHHGFLRAYISSYSNSPIFDQDEEWAKLGPIFAERKQKLMVFFGDQDDVTPPSLLERIREVVGHDNVDGHLLAGVGHEVPVFRPFDVVNTLTASWA